MLEEWRVFVSLSLIIVALVFLPQASALVPMTSNAVQKILVQLQMVLGLVCQSQAVQGPLILVTALVLQIFSAALLMMKAISLERILTITLTGAAQPPWNILTMLIV
jgi:hypothetical protein